MLENEEEFRMRATALTVHHITSGLSAQNLNELYKDLSPLLIMSMAGAEWLARCRGDVVLPRRTLEETERDLHSRADVIMFDAPQRGDRAHLAIAQSVAGALADLAIAPGGVDYQGLHMEVPPPCHEAAALAEGREVPYDIGHLWWVLPEVPALVDWKAVHRGGPYVEYVPTPEET